MLKALKSFVKKVFGTRPEASNTDFYTGFTGAEAPYKLEPPEVTIDEVKVETVQVEEPTQSVVQKKKRSYTKKSKAPITKE